MPKEHTVETADCKVKAVDKAEPSGSRSQTPVLSISTPVALNVPEVSPEKKEKKKRKKNRDGSIVEVNKPTKTKLKKLKKEKTGENLDRAQKDRKKNKDKKHKISSSPETDAPSKKKRKKKDRKKNEGVCEVSGDVVKIEKEPIVIMEQEPIIDSTDEAKLIIDLDEDSTTGGEDVITLGNSADLAPCV